MFNILRRTWIFLIMRIFVFILEIVILLFIASKFQMLLWRLFNVGVLGMILGGFLGIMFAYVIVSYVDRFLVFLLKLWNISTVVMDSDEETILSSLQSGISNVKKYFPAVGTIVVANTALQRTGKRLSGIMSEEIKDIPLLRSVMKLSDNFFVKRILEHIINYADECAIFYVFKCGDNSENSLITLGRGVLFYIKSFPSLAIGSLKLVLTVNILFPVVYLIFAIPVIANATGFINTLYTIIIAGMLLQIITRVILELFNMSFMMYTFEKCIVTDDNKNMMRAEGSTERFEEYEIDEDESLEYTNSLSKFGGTDTDLYSDLLADIKSRAENKENNAKDDDLNVFKLEQYEPIQSSDMKQQEYEQGQPSDVYVANVFQSISKLTQKELLEELNSLGLNFFK